MKRGGVTVLAAFVQETDGRLSPTDVALLVAPIDAVHIHMGTVGRADTLRHRALGLVNDWRKAKEASDLEPTFITVRRTGDRDEVLWVGGPKGERVVVMLSRLTRMGGGRARLRFRFSMWKLQHR